MTTFGTTWTMVVGLLVPALNVTVTHRTKRGKVTDTYDKKLNIVADDGHGLYVTEEKWIDRKFADPNRREERYIDPAYLEEEITGKELQAMWKAFPPEIIREKDTITTFCSHWLHALETVESPTEEMRKAIGALQNCKWDHDSDRANFRSNIKAVRTVKAVIK